MQEAPRSGSSVALISDRRLWLTAPLTDAKAEVVEDGDPRAAILLVGQGGEVTLDIARRFGLGGHTRPVAAAAAAPEAPAEGGPKAPEDAPSLPAPDEGEKARQPAEDKALRAPRPARLER